MFEADMRQIERLKLDLGAFAERAVPFALMQTMNSAAFDARKKSIDNISTKMILRNTFTKRSIQVEKATKINPESAVGSTLAYMEDQEFGTTLIARGKVGLPITTSYASGEGDTATPRRRLARKANSLRMINLTHARIKGTSKKQMNFLKVRETIRTGNRYVFLDLGRTKGIFRVIGKGKNARIRMVQDMSRKSALIKPRPWLGPAVDKTQKIMPQLFVQSLERQVQRQHLFIESP